MRCNAAAPARFAKFVMAALSALAFAQGVFAQSLYWDSNGTSLGAGTTPNGTWGVDNFWNPLSDGTGTPGAWLSGDTAVFSAGSDATGTFTVTLSGTQTVGAVNFEEGVATLTNGTLSLNGTGVVSVNASPVKAIIASQISGSVGLTKTLTGELALSGANNFTGNITALAGTIDFDNSQSAGAGSVTLSGSATANVTFRTTQVSTTLTNNFSLTNNSHLLEYSPDSGNTLALNGVISGNKAWNLDGTGTVILGGAANNTFSANVSVLQGTLVVQKDAALGTVGAGTAVSSGATLAFDGGFNYASAEPITLNGVGVSGAGALKNLTGANSFAGPITLNTVSSIGADAGTLTLNGAITGTGMALSKAGSGTVALAAANSYGSTVVSNGTLLINGSTTSSSVTVNSGATLGGTGSVSGTVALSGTISPGSSGVGAFASGAEEWMTGSAYKMEASDANGPAGTGYDTINITGGLIIDSGVTLKIVEVGTIANFNGMTQKDWTIATTTTGITGSPSSVTLDGTQFNENLHGGKFVLLVSGNNLILRFDPAPVITCPSNISQGNDPNQCSASVSFAASATDNGTFSISYQTNSVTVASPAVFPEGTTTVVATATDNVGNTATCSFTVTVNDVQAPNIACGSVTPQVANADASCNATVPDVRGMVQTLSTDNCTPQGSLIVGQSPLQGSTVNGAGFYPITVTVTDAANNSSQCVVPFTVNDVTPPAIVSCATNRTISVNGSCQAMVPDLRSEVVAHDNCTADGSLTRLQVPAPGTLVGLGSTLVTITIKDASNNSTDCSATVTVVDTTPPIAVANPITVHLDATGNYSLTPSDVSAISAGSSDNCTIATTSVTPNSFTCANLGANPVTLVVTDGSGNSATNTTSVTVQDTLAPVAVFTTISVQLDATGNYALTASDIAAIAAGSHDNCSIASTNVSPSTFTFCDVGSKSVTLTLTDGSGNSTNVTGNLTVVAPVATPLVVYVDASYPPTCSGPVTFPASAGSGAYYIGFNAFKTVQGGVNGVTSGGTVNVAAGSYSENVNASKPVTLLGVNQGVARCSPGASESVIAGGSTGIAIDVSSDDVTVDGFELTGATGLRDIGHVGVAVRNNLASIGGATTASSVGFDLEGIVTTVPRTLTIQNNCIVSASQLTLSSTAPQTAGIILLGVSGPQTPVIQNNNVTGAWFGYLLYSLNASTATMVQGGSISGAMQGVAIYNSFAVPPATPVLASSSFTINGVSVSGFAGNYSSPVYGPLTNFSFHAGVYAFSTGSDVTKVLTGTVTNVNVTGAGRISSDSSGLAFEDFSTGVGARQQIAVQNCVISGNTNRGVTVTGSNAVASITGSTIANNGFNPFVTGGNPGFGIIALGGATVTVSQCFITNPSTQVASTVNAVSATAGGASAPLGGLLTVSNCSIDNNGNANGFLAAWLAGTLNASGNWWGSNDPAFIAAHMTNTVGNNVDYTPWLNSGTDTDLITAGFQGDFSTLWVSEASPQTGAASRIQEGHDLATGATPKVIVVAGTYSEFVNITKAGFQLVSQNNAGVDARGARGAESIVNSMNAGGVIQVNANNVTIDGMKVGSGVIGVAVGSSSTEASILNNSLNGGTDGVLINGSATLKKNVASSPANVVGVYVSGSGAKALLENNSLTGDTEAGLKVDGGAIVDAGDCTGGDVTALGTGSGTARSSAGGNDLAGYGFDSASPWAIENVSSTGAVLADDDIFGATAGQDIGKLLLQTSPVKYTQSGGVLVTCPAGFSVECPFNVPTGASDLAGFLALGGTATANTATVSYSDSPLPLANGTVTRTYTITDECSQSTSCTQTITILDTIPPLISGTASPQSANADGSCNAVVPDVTASVRLISSDNCTSPANLGITQNPLPGSSVSGKGSHPITVTVTDASGLSSTTSVGFTVHDVTPPVLSGCPANIVVSGMGPTVVHYTPPTANDACDGTVVPVCNPPSDSTFPVGVTLVTCTATDSTGNSSSCSFYVDVCAGAATTYVDASYGATPVGTPVAWPNGGATLNHVIGCDAFATVQGGVNAVTAGGTVNVAAGTYAEHVSVSNPMTLVGANAGVDPRSTCGAGVPRNAEAIIDGGGTDAALAISANNVTVDGFTIQNGANGLNAGLWMSAFVTNVAVQNNVVTNNAIGIAAACSGTSTIRTNLVINNNLPGPAGGVGILAFTTTTNLMISDNELVGHTENNPINLQGGLQVGISILRNNIHDNFGSSALYVLQINGGVIAGNRIAADPTVSGIRFAGGNTNVAVSNNFFVTAAVGVRVTDDGYEYLGIYQNSGITIYGNSFGTMSSYAVAWESPAETGAGTGYAGPTLDASGNWWGDNTLAGIQAKIDNSGGPVDFTPWLDSGTPLVAGTCNGFSGDFSVLHASASSPQAGASGRIQEAIGLVTGGPGTIYVHGGLPYVEGSQASQIVINKNVNIIGDGSGTTTIQPAGDSAEYSDNNPLEGWWLIESGDTLNLSGVTLDGSGHKISAALWTVGNVTVTATHFENIGYLPSADYDGQGITAHTNAQVSVSGCAFDNIGRIGVFLKGPGVVGVINNNVYNGKGAGNWIDNAVEVSQGAHATIVSNTVQFCRGVADDGSTSTGIQVSTYYGGGTTAKLDSNVITENTDGVDVGYSTPDTSQVLLQNNDLRSNDNTAIFVTGGATIDAGNCTGAQYAAGLGISAGNNNLSGYVFDNAAPWAIEDDNTAGQPNVLAHKNIFGQTAGDVVEAVLTDLGPGNSRILATEEGVLNITCPAAVSVQCPNNVPAGVTGTGITAFDAFFALGGTAWANDGTISYIDGPLTPGPYDGTVTRTYTITDACGNAKTCNQTITVADTIAPVVSTWPASRTLDVGGACNFPVPNLVAEVTPFASDNCSLAAITQSPAAGSLISVGTTVVTVTVADNSGNAISNTVTLTVIDSNPTSATFVDVAYSGLTNGTQVNFPYVGGTGTHYIGCDAFTNIQAGINAVLATGTVNVAAGNYAELVTIGKPLSLMGPNAGIDPNLNTRNPEAVIFEPGNNPGSDIIVTVANTANVIVSGFTIDGDNNQAIPGQINASEGVNTVNSSSLAVRNNILRNFQIAGLDADGSLGLQTNINVMQNLVQNVPGQINVGYGYGILFENNSYGNITTNVTSGTRRGIQVDSNLTGPSNNVSIAGNQVDAGQVGIWINNSFQNTGGSVTIQSNTITSTAPSTILGASNPNYSGIFFSSLWANVGSVTTSSNKISGKFDYGILAWNNALDVNVQGDSINASNMQVGVLQQTVDVPYGSVYTGGQGLLTLGGLTISNAPVGVWIEDNGAGGSYPFVKASLQGTTILGSNGTIGIEITGPLAKATAYSNSVTGNGMGVVANTGVVLLQNNDLTGNTVAGISATNGAIVDAGNCTAVNTTGLGISAGGNNLSGYGFDSSAPWAIINGNTGGTPVVLTDHDNFGAVVGNNIATAVMGAVEYSQSPAVLSCPPPVTVVCEIGVPAPATDLTSFTSAGGYFSASAATVTSQDTPHPIGSGVITRTYTVTDLCGVQSTCQQTITVSDTMNPVVTCPGNITTNTDPGHCYATLNPGTATATDNCPGVAVAGVRNDLQPLNALYPKGLTTITWTATDTSGNTDVCVQTVTVADLEAPVVTVWPADTNLYVGANCEAPVPDLSPRVTATDNCTTISITQNPLAGTMISLGTTPVTVTVTDLSGNSTNHVVELTVLNDNPVPLATYVDTNYVGLTNGSVVTFPYIGGSGTHYVGCDAFGTIQAGIEAVTENGNGTVNVAAGNYVENVDIDRPLTLLGPNADISPNTGSRMNEAIIRTAVSDPNPNDANSQIVVYVEVGGVTINGFTVDGDNTNITSGVIVGSADVDAAEGIVSYNGVGSIRLVNNIVRNTSYSGIDFYNYVNSSATSTNYIENNKFDNIGYPPYGFGIAVLVYNNFYARIETNVMTNVRLGVQTRKLLFRPTQAPPAASVKTQSVARRWVFSIICIIKALHRSR